MNLNRPTRSIRLLQTDRTCEDRLREIRRPSHAMSMSILMSDQELACSRGTCVRGGFFSSTPV